MLFKDNREERCEIPSSIEEWRKALNIVENGSDQNWFYMGMPVLIELNNGQFREGVYFGTNGHELFLFPEVLVERYDDQSKRVLSELPGSINRMSSAGIKPINPAYFEYLIKNSMKKSSLELFRDFHQRR